MSRLFGRLGSLVARDVMTRDVICVQSTDTVDSAVDTLKAHHIAGAPVVDTALQLVGILSVDDLIVVPNVDSPMDERPPVALSQSHDRATWRLFEQVKRSKEEKDDRVADRMSRNVMSVNEDTPLVDVARTMCDGHWHRVPVVDAQGALAGIISTMDILAALVNTVDEPE